MIFHSTVTLSNDFILAISNTDSQTDQNTEFLTVNINGKRIPCFVVFADNSCYNDSSNTKPDLSKNPPPGRFCSTWLFSSLSNTKKSPVFKAFRLYA